MVLGLFKAISVMAIPSIHNATIIPMLQIISTRPRFLRVAACAAILAAVFSGCADVPSSPPGPTIPPTSVAENPEPEYRIVVLGDSLAAGLGLAEAEAFNAGVSGDTSAGGLSRIDWVLQQPAEILVIELGSNDALRGQPLENTETNLRAIVRRGRESGASVLLLGMDVPSNYGPDHATAFAELYPRIAEEEGVVLVPGFVRELGRDPTLLQPDGLHPTAEGQRRLARALRPYLVELLKPPISSSTPP